MSEGIHCSTSFISALQEHRGETTTQTTMALLQFFCLSLLSTLLPLQASARSVYPAPKAGGGLPRCASSRSNGFNHPGIYHDCSSLDRLQANYQSKKSAYIEALASTIARESSLQDNANWTMFGPFYEVNWAGADGHNIPLQRDGKSSYMLTLGWYATGNPLWLSRAKEIILAWATTLRILNEQIQGGEGLAYMTASAEILRASSAHSGWSKENTTAYLTMIEAIIAPWNETEGLTRNNFFMNQGFYGNSGAMAAAVFSENRTMYEDMIYHASVGANPDPTIDYAIPIQISGDPSYYGEVTEMGRDQAHPMGTLRGLSFLGQTNKIQHGAADFFTQNSSRLLAGFEYWSKYNTWHDDVPWQAREVRPGSGEVWYVLNDTRRGANYATYWMPVEAIGCAYFEYSRRGVNTTYYKEYVSNATVGWDTFEWGDDRSVAALGFNLTRVE